MSDKKWKIIFMGTPAFAAPCLEKLITSENVIAVFTQPDRPSGRGLKLTPPPIKEVANKYKIPCFQPKSLKSDAITAQFKKLAPDLVVVALYGLFLPTSILDIPKHKTINVHPSLIPRYRGADPIKWALLNGDKKTGISMIYVTPKMDAGDVLTQLPINILETDNLESLEHKLSALSVKALTQAISKLKSGKAKAIKQDERKVVFAPRLTKESGHIDWSKPARDIFNLIRATYPWPGAYTFYNGEKLKIHAAKVLPKTLNGTPGKVHKLLSDGIAIETPKGLLLLTELQRPNKKRMSASDFIKGHPIKAGSRLGK